MVSLTVQARAKVNLTLDVFNLRADGFHSLASVFQTISLCDTIDLAKSTVPGIRIRCEGEHAALVPDGASNLVTKAIQAIIDVTGSKCGIDVVLHKNIPTQAGLGGGSSDAAATLLGTTALLDLDIGPKLLHELAAKLGSDVPFFLSGGTAVVRGRGESVQPMADGPALWMVIVKPAVDVATAWAYRALDELPDRTSNRATKMLVDAIKEGDIARVIACQSNDFEAPVFRCFPDLAWVRDELRMAGCQSAHLCGSGSALYGLVKDARDARLIAGRLLGTHPKTYVARTTSRIESNPLRGQSR